MPVPSDFEALIFDMDGVLIDSEPLWKIAMEEVFGKLGSRLTKKDFQKTVGIRIDEVVHFWNLEEQWGLTHEHKVVEDIIKTMESLIYANPFPLMGVMDTLEFFKKSPIKTGLATSSPHRLMEAVLKSLNIGDAFDSIHSAEHEAYGKPHPAVYLKASEALDVKPAKCLVIEDSLNGIISAKAAKMKVVCIPEKTQNPEPKLILADFHYDNMQSFLEDFSSRNKFPFHQD
jgi:sugar-phosphatase